MSPEMLSRYTLLAAYAGHCGCTLPFEIADHRGNRVFRGNGNAHMHMVRHRMPFDDLEFLLPCDRMNNTSLPSALTKQHLALSFGSEHHMVFTVPARMG